jgi:pilus assembly protein Flp/PilA
MPYRVDVTLPGCRPHRRLPENALCPKQEEEVNFMFAYFHALWSREEGQGLVEYGLIISLVSLACIGGLTALGLGLDGLFNSIVGRL